MKIAKGFAMGLLSLLGFVGCKKPEAVPVVVTPVGHVTTKELPIELQFERRYVVKLTHDITMTITTKNTPYMYLFADTKGVEWTGELKQSDGKYIFFDPFSPADRIIRPELIALVTPWIPAIRNLDEAYRENVTQFTDSKGNTWTKNPSSP